MNNEPSIFFHEVNERQGIFHRRAFLLGGVLGGGFLALSTRMGVLQLVENQRYQNLSASNQYNFRLVPPPRGRIVDRNGVLLAGNRPNFRLLVSKDEVKNPQATLDQIAQIIPLDDSRRRQVVRDLNQSAHFVPVSVKDDLTWEEFSRINVRAPELPGVTADMGEVRLYPFGGAFAHVIGYVAKVSADDMKKEGPNPDPVLLHPGFRIGKQGVEKAFDKELRGRAGAQKVEVDSRGRVVRKDSKGDIAAIPGQEVMLSLDADIQNRALEVFGQESGAAVMMDVRTGDVLCLMSAPSFDANQFVAGLSRADYQALAQYERQPLLNKALSGTFPPGSTFKTMVALAALEQGVNPAKTYVCNGAWQFGNHTFHCDKSHGVVNMHDAIKTSCDIFFYQTALGIGPDVIAATARHFGINEIFEEIHIAQKRGTLPDTAWKRRVFHDRWYPGETPSFGIGQGALNVNPLQLCVMCARLANGKKALMPRLIKSIGGRELPRGDAVADLPFKQQHIQFVRDAMASVANDAGGTAFAVSQLGLGPVKMAGKTGTAQSHSTNTGHAAGLSWELKDHAWFIAFAPYDDPRYALSVLVEHGGWGASAAAPRAREIMRVALLKDPSLQSRIVQTDDGPPPPVTDQDATVLHNDGDAAPPGVPT